MRLLINLLALVVLVAFAPPAGAGDPETDGKTAKVVGQFLESVKAGKPEQMTTLAGFPWLAEGGQVVTDEKAFRMLLAKRFGKPADPVFNFEVRSVMPYPLEDPPKAHEKKLFDQVLGKKGEVVLVADMEARVMRYLLVLSTDAGPRVVGGPYPLTYLLMPNKVPAAAKELMEKAEEVELLSLDPKRPKEKQKDEFHGWKVLGRTVVKDDLSRKKLLTELRNAAEASDGLPAACFNPRHGLRLTQKGKKIDLVICFECLQVDVFDGDKDRQEFLITDTPQAAYDKVLRGAGIPLPDEPKK